MRLGHDNVQNSLEETIKSDIKRKEIEDWNQESTWKEDSEKEKE